MRAAPTRRYRSVPANDARLSAALTTAMAEVARVRQARWHLNSPGAVRSEFERIARELAVLHAGAESGVDLERLGALVRAVAAWQPDHGLPLIGALGAVVRAARATMAGA